VGKEFKFEKSIIKNIEIKIQIKINGKERVPEPEITKKGPF
jgi:hypothetical protein